MGTAALAVLMLSGISVGLYFGARTKRKRLELYRAVAARYPESSVTDGGFWRRHELHVTLEGARIKMWMWANKNSQGTIWEARMPAPVGEFRVYREGVGSSIGKLLGTQDIEIGAHRDFDDNFMVKGDDPPLVRQVWSRQRCEQMLSRFPRGRIDADGRELVLTEYRMLETAPEIREGIELIGALARCDLYGVEALRSLHGSTFHDGRPPYVIARGTANVQIGPVATPDGTVTRATCLAGGGDDRPAPDQLDAIGARFTRAGEQLHITWPGIETSSERLTAAIELLRELTRGPSTGVFR